MVLRTSGIVFSVSRRASISSQEAFSCAYMLQPHDRPDDEQRHQENAQRPPERPPEPLDAHRQRCCRTA
jgi:hypothetical protein